MRQNYDADVRKLDGDEFSACPKCGTFMLPLRNYEISKSEAPTLGAESWEFILYGWIIFVYNFVFDAITFKSRELKLAQLKKDVLAISPKSLICPACLNLRKRN